MLLILLEQLLLMAESVYVTIYGNLCCLGSRVMRFDPTAYKAEKDRQRKEIELKRWVTLIIIILIIVCKQCNQTF